MAAAGDARLLRPFVESVSLADRLSWEVGVPYYLVEVSYKDTAVKAMVANPQDRSAPVRKMAESLGGRMHSFFFAFGDYDIVTIVELPSNQTATAVAMAVGATGGFSKYRTTVLMTAEEAVHAMRDANKVSYSAPS